MWGDIAIAFLLAFITAFSITPYTIKVAKKVGAVDYPNKRRVNKDAIPRLGGIAVIVGFFVSIIYLLTIMSIEKTINLNGIERYGSQLAGFFGGVAVLFVICLVDDIKGLPAWIKLLGQIIAATIVVIAGVKINILEILGINSPMFSQFATNIFTILWIVAITNAINLIDGLDGLSSGITLISCISLLIIFSLNNSPIIGVILITALAGGIVGFLPYNTNPAKTFIGDVGSNFLGFSLSIIAILGMAKTYTAIVIVAPLIVLALPLCDTIFAIIRRIVKGKSLKAIFSPDRGHLHHRLMDKGYTQKQAVYILYGISATLGMFAVILLESGIWKALSFGLMVVAIFAIGYKEIINNVFKKDE